MIQFDFIKQNGQEYDEQIISKELYQYNKNSFLSRDLGPGNCLIDEWIRRKTKNKFDNN